MPPSSTAKGQRAHAAILRAATSVFARHGSRGPLAAVATEADLTQQGLLHHFPSKRSLLLAVLEHRDREAVRMMNQRAWTEGGHASLDALRNLVAHNATTPELVQMFTVLAGESVSAEHPAHGFFAERYAHHRARVTRTIQQGQDRGEFRADADAAVLASLVLAVMDGLQVQWLLDPEQDMVRRFETFVEMVTTFLAPPAIPAD